MRSPKTKTLVFAIIGLVVLASISIAPCAKFKPVLGADGAPLHKPDGSVVMTADTAFMWSVNWFGYSVLILAALLFGWLLLRLGRLLLCRFSARREL
jgi:hypothetical protein